MSDLLGTVTFDQTVDLRELTIDSWVTPGSSTALVETSDTSTLIQDLNKDGLRSRICAPNGCCYVMTIVIARKNTI